MTDCYFHHTTPLNITSKTFYESTRQQLTLHVPSGCKAQYATAEYWKDFKEIVDDIPATAISPVLTNQDSELYYDIRGNRIAGDDLYLLNAISEDKASVTFTALSNLYDLSSRTLRSELALLPLGVKASQREALRSGNLDETLDLIEREDIDLIPVEDIGFTYNDFDADIDHFLQWVVREGQQYNHEAGFLQLTNQEVESQLRLLAQNN